MDMDRRALALLRRLPELRRARDYRLYLANGARLVDLWQRNGRALLGHTPKGVLGQLKQAGDRGLFSPLPSPWEGRLLRLLSKLFPARGFRLYGSPGALQEALDAFGLPPGPFPDPAFPEGASPANGALPGIWRPFLGASPLETPQELISRKALAPMLPTPESLHILALDPALDAQFPPGELIPPAILAMAVRGTANLLAAAPRPAFPWADKAEGGWTRRGIYLTLPEASPLAADYSSLWETFLRGGFLLPPSPGAPLILPGELSPGEEAKLARLLSPGG